MSESWFVKKIREGSTLLPQDWDRLVDAHHTRSPGGTFCAFAPARGPAGLSSYEALARAVTQAAEHTTEAAEHTTAPGVVLDVACGDGAALAAVLHRARGRKMGVGVDRSSAELAGARRRLGKDVPLVQGEAGRIPLSTACADAVICHLGLMLFSDLPRALADIGRLLRPGGTFAAIVEAPPAVPVPDSLECTWGEVLTDFWNSEFGRDLPDLPLDGRFEPAGLVELCRSVGAFSTGATVTDASVSLSLSPEDLWDRFLSGIYLVSALTERQKRRLRAMAITSFARRAAPDHIVSLHIPLNLLVARRSQPKAID